MNSCENKDFHWYDGSSVNCAIVFYARRTKFILNIQTSSFVLELYFRSIRWGFGDSRFQVNFRSF